MKKSKMQQRINIEDPQPNRIKGNKPKNTILKRKQKNRCFSPKNLAS